MHHRESTRRRVLKGLGCTAVSVVGTTVVSGVGASTSSWESVAAPTDATIHDVVYTSAGAFAVAEGGAVLERTPVRWRSVVGSGPGGDERDLYAADVTGDGRAFWVVGADGAIGEFDVDSGIMTDHSASTDVTNTFTDVSVIGTAGEATVSVADDSGTLYVSSQNGGRGTWQEITPGDGAAITAVEFHERAVGHVVDSNTSVFATDGGESWTRIGKSDADGDFHAVDSDGACDVWVTGAGGVVYNWDGSEWTATDIDDVTLRDIEITADFESGYAVGDDASVYRLAGGDWERESTPGDATLHAVGRGSHDIAVGASGTIIEK